MTTAIGVVITDHIAAARLEDRQLAGPALRYPVDPDTVEPLEAIPDSELIDLLAGQIESLAGGKAGPVDAIGVAVPGIVRAGVVEESPNLPQMKGVRLADQLTSALKERGIAAPVHISNDADAIAAGVAATRNRLDKLTRVWTIGNGIGYAFSTWNPKRSLPTPKTATCAAASLLTCGTAHWPPPPLRSFIWQGQGVFTSPEKMWASSSCRCCAAISKPWSA
jgi:hypothetical protein